MTPREVQLSIRAASELRLDRMDELILAAWQGARWGRAKRMPDLKDALTVRRRVKRRPKTLEEDVRRWETFFRRVSAGKAN